MSRVLPKGPFVDRHYQFIEHLDALSANLENGTDLAAILGVLLDDLAVVVPSLLGLEITILIGQSPVTFSTMNPVSSPQVRASLQFPLTAVATAEPRSVVTYYAALAGAFAELASATRAALRLDGQVIVDRHLTPGSDVPVVGLDELVIVGQATGILMGRYGYGPDEAVHELQECADRTRTPLEVAAQQVVDERPT